jgi:probable addiction module antidote protein
LLVGVSQLPIDYEPGYRGYFVQRGKTFSVLLAGGNQRTQAGDMKTALGDMTRAKGMTQIASDAGLGRESLYRALCPDGNPEFATIMKVVNALGLKLNVTPWVE